MYCLAVQAWNDLNDHLPELGGAKAHNGISGEPESFAGYPQRRIQFPVPIFVVKGGDGVSARRNIAQVDPASFCRQRSLDSCRVLAAVREKSLLRRDADVQYAVVITLPLQIQGQVGRRPIADKRKQQQWWQAVSQGHHPAYLGDCLRAIEPLG